MHYGIPKVDLKFGEWCSKNDSDSYLISNGLIDFNKSDWQECIVTYKDLEAYEVESITISKPEYDRLLACESKLNELIKILEK